MVNRQGRSKGCITCRRRKVKCDEGRPLCLRCLNSAKNCEGYPDSRTLVWVASKDSDAKSTAAASEASSSSTAAAALSHISSLQPTSRAQQRSLFTNTYPFRLQDFAHMSLPPDLDYHAFQETFYQTYLFQHLLGHAQIGMESVLSEAIQEPTGLHRNSVNALCMTFFGRMHMLPEISHQGDLLYSKAILQLAARLNEGSEAFSTEVLAATLTLTVHEVVNSTAHNGWIQHAGGIGRLIEARGPWRHQSPRDLILFESSRPMIIAKALADHERTFLEQPDWQTIPWALAATTKTYQNNIFDILSVVPGLFKDVVDLKNEIVTTENMDRSTNPGSSLGASQKTRALEAKIAAKVSMLDHWHEAWTANHPTAVQIAPDDHPFENSNIPYPSHLFGPPLLCSSLQHANEYSLYNVAMFLLLTIARDLSSALLSFPTRLASARETDLRPDTVDNAQTSINLSRNRRRTATGIARSVPYHLQFGEHAYSGAYLLCFPLNVLLGICGVKSEEGQWIAKVLTEITSKWGIMAGSAWTKHVQENPGSGECVWENITHEAQWWCRSPQF